MDSHLKRLTTSLQRAANAKVDLLPAADNATLGPAARVIGTSNPTAAPVVAPAAQQVSSTSKGIEFPGGLFVALTGAVKVVTYSFSN